MCLHCSSSLALIFLAFHCSVLFNHDISCGLRLVIFLCMWIFYHGRYLYRCIELAMSRSWFRRLETFCQQSLSRKTQSNFLLWIISINLVHLFQSFSTAATVNCPDLKAQVCCVFLSPNGYLTQSILFLNQFLQKNKFIFFIKKKPHNIIK